MDKVDHFINELEHQTFAMFDMMEQLKEMQRDIKDLKYAYAILAGGKLNESDKNHER